MDIARTIIAQIPAMTRAAIGARDFVATDAGVVFRFGGSRALDKFEITLNAGDLYDVRAVRINRRTYEIAELGAFADVYADSLGTVIESLARKAVR